MYECLCGAPAHKTKLCQSFLNISLTKVHLRLLLAKRLQTNKENTATTTDGRRLLFLLMFCTDYFFIQTFTFSG